ncbi:adenylosuccinate lyase [Candidatus Pacearchaeota archaeon]|nr:adenylosuccinate lyase [Candidatus Pacearchaeota archaeon]
MGNELILSELTAISPIDGRYGNKTKELRQYFSEYGLMKYRAKIEIEYLIALSKVGVIREFNQNEITNLKEFYANFNLEMAERIKEAEKITNHDVKAVEYILKEFIKKNSLEYIVEMVHFGLTSYDINDNALYLMTRDSMSEVYIPKLKRLEGELINYSKDYKDIAMLARTHGQPASPTTLGKEFMIYALRLAKEINILKNLKYPGKLNCATGNFNSLYAAYPTIDWIEFSKNFVENLGLAPNLITTQIEPHDKLVEWSQLLIRINNILIDFNQDLWHYISDDWIVQRPKKEEIGSSTMPHKINPIDFENSEGNAIMSNGVFSAFVSRLQQSRLQRDLVDSTITRNVGTAVAHSLLAVKSAVKGLEKIYANYPKIKEELNQHPEILSEAYQTILRREGFEMPYEKLKELTRGKKVSLEDMHNFVFSLDISEKIKNELLDITPSTYIGIAPKLVDIGVEEIEKLLR